MAEGDSGTGTVESGSHFLRFPVTLSEAPTADIAVNYATANGTATAGSGYLATSGTLFIRAGQTAATIEVPVLGDGIVEPGETLTLSLSNAAGATLGTATATGTILNDDANPLVSSIARAASTPNQNPSLPFTVTFTKSVTGVDAGDFAVTKTGSISGTGVTGVSGSGTTYTVTVGSATGGGAAGGSASGISGSGTIRLDLIDNDSITDAAGNLLGGKNVGGNGGSGQPRGDASFKAGEVYTRNSAAATGAIINEFRFHGAAGTTDEYVEVLNTTGAPLDISGWSIQTRTVTGLQTTLVPLGKSIPTFGHVLFTGGGYSLGGYDLSDLAIATDVLDSSGVALFNAAGALQDAVGFAASEAALKEGAGLPAYPTANGEYAFMRDFIVSQSKNTDDSSNDFVFVSTTGVGVAGETAPGTPATVAAQLGAPSPEGLTSPSYFNHQTISTLLDPSVASGVAPNRARITGGGTLGTLIVRRTIKNNSAVPITRLRLSVTSITSLNSAGFGNSAQADVRLVSGAGETGVLLANGTTMVSTEGTTLEAGTGQPQQALGGGLGSSIDFGTITLSAPLMPGASRNYNFRLQIERGGSYFIALNILALTQ